MSFTKTSKPLWLTGLVILVMAQSPVFAQSKNLPTCQGDYDTSTWTNCFGKRVNPNGDIYIGGFLHGVAHGNGTYTFTDGTQYVGQYKNGRRDGTGIEYAPDGSIRINGRWEKGVLQKSSPQSDDDKQSGSSDTPTKSVTKADRDQGRQTVSEVNGGSTTDTLLNVLLTRRWRISPTKDCESEGGNYAIYDKKEGRYFVNNGSIDVASKRPEVEVKELDADTVMFHINYLANAAIAKALHDDKVYSTKLELMVKRDKTGKITETERAVIMDIQAAQMGVKKFKNESSDPSELMSCEGSVRPLAAPIVASSVASGTNPASVVTPSEGVASAAPATSATSATTATTATTATPTSAKSTSSSNRSSTSQTRYDGIAKLVCELNVDCTSKDDLAAKMKIRGDRALKMNQSWAATCLNASQQVPMVIGPIQERSAKTALKMCNAEYN